jgi:predicted DNA-binding transcriptional regulator AlpA
VIIKGVFEFIGGIFMSVDPNVAVLTEKEAAEYVRVALITFRRMRSRGEGPKVLQLSPRRIGFRRATLDAWLAARETEEGGVE